MVKHWKTTLGGVITAVCSYLLAQHIGDPGIVGSIQAIGALLLGAAAADSSKTTDH